MVWTKQMAQCIGLACTRDMDAKVTIKIYEHKDFGVHNGLRSYTKVCFGTKLNLLHLNIYTLAQLFLISF